MFSWYTLGPLVPFNHRLSATAYLRFVPDHVYRFMTTVLLMLFKCFIYLMLKENSSQF